MLLLVPVVGWAAGQGVYVDAAGGRHEWTITETHALLWNGKPFVPFGTWFVSHYLDTGREEQWTEDVAALELLVGKGITDFYFGWANRPPEMYQRLIDWFEAHGCTYGIIPARYDWDPLYGYKMSPQRHDLPVADALRIAGDSERLQLAGTAFVLVSQAGESLQAGAREAEARNAKSSSAKNCRLAMARSGASDEFGSPARTAWTGGADFSGIPTTSSPSSTPCVPAPACGWSSTRSSTRKVFTGVPRTSSRQCRLPRSFQELAAGTLFDRRGAQRGMVRRERSADIP
jgi:hypothetical protein